MPLPVPRGSRREGVWTGLAPLGQPIRDLRHFLEKSRWNHVACKVHSELVGCLDLRLEGAWPLRISETILTCPWEEGTQTSVPQAGPALSSPPGTRPCAWVPWLIASWAPGLTPGLCPCCASAHGLSTLFCPANFSSTFRS